MVYFSHPNLLRNQPQPGHHKLEVEGVGSISVKPDIAIITLGVITESENVQNAQTQNTMKMNKVLQALDEVGVNQEQIQTLTFTIQPIYQYVDGEQIFKGYKVQHILEITVTDLSQTGEIYQAAISVGANIVDNIRYDLSDKMKEKSYQQALILALNQATLKAQTITHSLGVSLLPIPIKITENSSPHTAKSSPIHYSSMETAPPIQERDIKIEATLDVLYYYGQ
ncbi:SIMPL domain-containing protein [Bacillus weihaiensis]|uniref:SIMPL domain-containing protein n=1 Tax=Bacillus weihaiensis TaxID=1547283 RepID=A0A1L3MR79_9BACI|nr:SIMPL domain-containing protein [Bacillus weihaiensis]APH04831.1 hypothetical protein A9C19_08770 [Bacillus weihaiensis]